MSSSAPLISKQEPLTPSGAVRVVAFWAPTLALIVALHFWPFFRSLGLFLQLLLGGSAALVTICVTAYYTAVWQLKPLPTDEELEALGGKRFLRPSDGKVMEYWLSGQPGAKTVVVFCHRMDGKLGADYARTKVDAMLRGKSACLISPSIPSLSASPPYDANMPVQWLKQWTQDMMRLLEDLGAEHVYVLGLSWGAQLCLNLAMACQEKGQLRGIAQIGGNCWDTKLVQYDNGADAGGYAAKFIFSRPAVTRPMAYLLMRPMIPKLGDVDPVGMSSFFEEDRSLMSQGMVRSMSYYLHQMWQIGVSGAQESDHYVDLSKFDPKIPMILNLGKEDNSAHLMQQPFLDQVPHAELKMYDGSHGGFPLAQLIENLMMAAMA